MFAAKGQIRGATHTYTHTYVDEERFKPVWYSMFCFMSYLKQENVLFVNCFFFSCLFKSDVHMLQSNKVCNGAT